MLSNEPIRYSILDPSGNITALVESAVGADARAVVAAELMRRHPEVEQVGFVHRTEPGDPVRAELNMAGGEFCGNASLCTAALLLLDGDAPVGTEASVPLRVSGVRAPVEVRIRREAAERFRGGLRMPPALSVGETELRLGGVRAPVPLVRMEGISHLILRPDCAFFPILLDRGAAEEAVRRWCADLGADCLGLMFLEGELPALRLTPLVFVPGSGTLFWENSCASGSAAAALFLTAQSGAPVDLSLEEPGGSLRVQCGGAEGETRLIGGLRLRGRHTL